MISVRPAWNGETQPVISCWDWVRVGAPRCFPTYLVLQESQKGIHTKQELPKYIAEFLWNMVHFSVQTKTLKFRFKICRNNWSEISLIYLTWFQVQHVFY